MGVFKILYERPFLQEYKNVMYARLYRTGSAVVFSLCCLALIVPSCLQAREEAAEEERARRGEEGEEGNEEAGPPARRSQEDPLRAGAGQAEKAYAHAPSSLSGLPFTPTSLTRNPRTSVLADAALPLPGPRHERQGRRSEEVQFSPFALSRSTPPKP